MVVVVPVDGALDVLEVPDEVDVDDEALLDGTVAELLVDDMFAVPQPAATAAATSNGTAKSTVRDLVILGNFTTIPPCNDWARRRDTALAPGA